MIVQDYYLLTNDGDIYNKIIHPRVKITQKIYSSCKGTYLLKIEIENI